MLACRLISSSRILASHSRLVISPNSQYSTCLIKKGNTATTSNHCLHVSDPVLVKKTRNINTTCRCLTNNRNDVLQETSLEPYVDPIYSYAFGRSTSHLIYRTVGQQLEETVSRVPNKTAVISVHQGIKKTYAELNSDVNKLAKALYTNLGIRRGDVVSMWSANIYEFFVVQYALAKIGAVYCSISPLNKTAEVEHILHQANVKALFLPSPQSPQNFVNNFLEVLNAVNFKNKATNLKNIVFLEGNEEVKNEENGFMSQGYHNLMNSSDGIITDDMTQEVQPEDICNIFFTSGTTGKPKGAASSHFVMLNDQRLYFASKRRIPFDNDITFCLTLPLFHGFAGMGAVYALPSRPLTVVLPDYRYTAEAVVDAIDQHKCSDLWLVPAMAVDILMHATKENTRLESLKIIGAGAAPVPEEVVVQLKHQFKNVEDVVIGYGATETGPCAVYPNIDADESTKKSSCGTPLDFNEIKIIDPKTNRLVKHGESGEVCVRGQLMHGYWGEEDKTREVIQHGWYLTGDLGTMDDKGCIKINGRTKELIIRGGSNIYPREVEDLLHQHPNVGIVAVCGIKHDKLGEEVVAWIRRKDNNNKTTVEEIKEFCKEKISYYKVPSKVLFVDSFPVTASGKFQKFIMTEKSPGMIQKQKDEGLYL